MIQNSTRLLCTIYALLAFVEVPSVLRLMNGDFIETGNNKFVIGIKACMPTEFSYEYEGDTISTEVPDVNQIKCKGVEVLVFATVTSLCISAVASLLYVYRDWRTTTAKKGTVNLIFVLLQAGLVMAALLREVNFWESSYEMILEGMYGDGASARVHGSKILLGAACAFCFLSCFALILRKGMSLFSSGETATSSAVKPPTTEGNLALEESVDAAVVIPAGETKQSIFSPPWASKKV